MVYGTTKKTTPASKRVKTADKAIAKAKAKPTVKNKAKATKAIKVKKSKPTYRNTF